MLVIVTINQNMFSGKFFLNTVPKPFFADGVKYSQDSSDIYSDNHDWVSSVGRLKMTADRRFL